MERNISEEKRRGNSLHYYTTTVSSGGISCGGKTRKEKGTQHFRRKEDGEPMTVLLPA